MLAGSPPHTRGIPGHQIAPIHCFIGRIYTIMDDPLMALKHYSEARAILERVLPAGHETLDAIQNTIDNLET